MAKLLWFDESNSHSLMYYCFHVMDDGTCNPHELFINLLRRDEVKSAISPTSLDQMSIALRTACLEPGDMNISDQQGQSFYIDICHATFAACNAVVTCEIKLF